MRSRKKTTAIPVPNLHFLFIVCVVGLLVLSMILYAITPEPKATLFATMIVSFSSFLGGKLTNSFGKPLNIKDPTILATPQEDDDESEGDSKDTE